MMSSSSSHSTTRSMAALSSCVARIGLLALTLLLVLHNNINNNHDSSATAFQINTNRNCHANDLRCKRAAHSHFPPLHLSNNDDINQVKVSVRASELDSAMGLSQDERTIVNIHRTCSPSVVFVTSVLLPLNSRNNYNNNKLQNKMNNSNNQMKNKSNGNNNRLPQGTSLGSGSGFVVDADGYIITNYHVIQRAYEANQARMRYDSFWQRFKFNVTEGLEKSWNYKSNNRHNLDLVGQFVNQTVDAIVGRGTTTTTTSANNNGNHIHNHLPAQVFVRFGTNGNDDGSGSWSGASYRQCEIVDVVKELDVAVLRIINENDSHDEDSNSSSRSNNTNNNNDSTSSSSQPTTTTTTTATTTTFQPLQYGSSSSLLAGQTLLAIGNPFGLDRTITSGLVSALGRTVTGVAGNPIRNCIQTDAAINPGNSGGPLLDLRGQVVGVNTMIVSTSGSSAGIGFAVPGDKVKELTVGIVDRDKEVRRRNGRNNGGGGRMKGRGWLGVEVAMGSLEESLRRRLGHPRDLVGREVIGAFLTNVTMDAGSPLGATQDDDDEDDSSSSLSSSLSSQLNPTTIFNGNVMLGDRIIDIGGKSIWNGVEFMKEMKERVEGEQIVLTVENASGEKRVVYVTLGRIPL